MATDILAKALNFLDKERGRSVLLPWASYSSGYDEKSH